MREIDFFYDNLFLRTSLICYDLNDILMNVQQERIDYFSSEKPSPVVMIFLVNYKIQTMPAQQFYKQALIFTYSY